LLDVCVKTFTSLSFNKTSKKFLFLIEFKLKLCLLLKKWVGQTNSNNELKSNNFKNAYSMNIVNIWSKAPQTFVNKADVLNKDSNTLR